MLLARFKAINGRDLVIKFPQRSFDLYVNKSDQNSKFNLGKTGALPPVLDVEGIELISEPLKRYGQMKLRQTSCIRGQHQV